MPSTQLGNLFKLFSVAFGTPTPALAGTVTNGGMARDFSEVWGALELPAQDADAFCSALAAYEGRDAQEAMHEIRRDWTHLFLGEDALVANTEGVWRKKREGKKKVARMINTYSLEVQRFMRECGVTRAQGHNDCVDYLSEECDFCAFLADSPAYLVDMGKDPADLLQTFIDEHLKLWAPGFCDDVREHARCDYYRALCALMQAFVGAL